MSLRARDGFQRLAAASIVSTLILVALGGLVRATDNGLACPDWPLCYGRAFPRQADLPPGLTLWNVWVEHSHRVTAMLVGLLVLALAVWALRRHRGTSGVVGPALAALVLVTVQAWLGGQVVLERLRDVLVTAHLGMAMAVVGCLVLVLVNAAVPPRPTGDRDLRFARLATGVAALAYVQALVGSWVTGTGAGLAFTDFPLTGGRIVPVITDAREAVHVTHRLLAYGLVAAVVLLCARAAAQRSRPDPAARLLVRLPMWAAVLIVVQIGLGVANLVTGLSPWSVTPHLAVASWIWTLLVAVAILAYRYAPEATPRTPASRPTERAST